MKLVQFSDIHLRSSPSPQSQFHVQPFWLGQPVDLFSRLARLTRDADAILFTGDAAHSGDGQQVARFFDLLANTAAGKPVFMVVGNHDVANPAWPDHFHRGIEQHKNFHLDEDLYPLDQVDIALINNEYLTREGGSSSCWQEGFFAVPVLNADRAQKLDVALSASTDRPAIVMTHCPSHVFPGTLFDFTPAISTGMDRYRELLHGVLDKHPRVAAVLSGHVHYNSTRLYNHGRVHQTLASIGEYPCQVRLLEVDRKRCLSRLVSLASESEVEEAFQFPGA